MKRLLGSILIFAIYLITSANTYPADRTTKKYDLNNFSKVEAGSGMLVNISQSSSYSIEINAEQEDFEYLKVEKKGNSLEIYIDRNNYRKHGDIKVKIQMPSLRGIDLSGGFSGETILVDPEQEPEPGDEILIQYRNGRLKLHSFINCRKGQVTVDSIVGEKSIQKFSSKDIKFMHKIIAVFRSGTNID